MTNFNSLHEMYNSLGSLKNVKILTQFQNDPDIKISYIKLLLTELADLLNLYCSSLKVSVIMDLQCSNGYIFA